jgi:hypothetical protein
VALVANVKFAVKIYFAAFQITKTANACRKFLRAAVRLRQGIIFKKVIDHR